MKSFGAYISKYLASFAAFILLLLFINVIIFVVAFRKTVTEDYGAAVSSNNVGANCRFGNS